MQARDIGSEIIGCRGPQMASRVRNTDSNTAGGQLSSLRLLDKPTARRMRLFMVESCFSLQP